MKQAIKKSLCIVLTALMLLTAAPLAGFVGMEFSVFGEEKIFSSTAEAYSGSTYTSNTEIANKLNKVFNGSADIFSNDDDVDQNLAIGGYVNNTHSYKYGSYSGYQCYAYANAVYNYLFGEVPYHGNKNYSYSTVVLKNTSKPPYETLMSAGVACGAYVRTDKSLTFADWGSNGHSYIILSYDNNEITILDANSNDGSYYGNILIQTLSWADFNNKSHYYHITHIVQPNITKGTNCKHSYSGYVCTKCNSFDPASVTSKSVNKSLKVVKSGAVDHTGPYGDCKKVNSYSTGTVLTATAVITNGYDHTWYKLSNGNYIWDDYVQNYTITYENIPTGTYYIKNVASGDYMSVAQSKDVNTQDVMTWQKTGETGMQMIITKASTGYKIRPSCSASRLVNPYGDTVDSGLNVNIYNDVNDSSQWWLFEKVGSSYVIRNVQNTSCVLAAPGGSQSSVSVQTYSGGNDQKWVLEAITSCISHSYTSTVTTSATCTTAGVRTYTCSLCGAKKTESIPVLSHSYNSGVVTKSPTCGATGVRTYTCSRCGGIKTETIAKLTTHTYNSGVVTKAATCGATGIKTYTCTVCGTTRTETIAKLTTHTYNSGVVTKAATCATTGIKTYTCAVCGATKTENIAKLTTHTYDSGVVTKEPTETESGIKTFTCTVCGATKTESVVVSDSIAHGMCGVGLTWILDRNGTLTISGTGEMTDYYYDAPPWYDYSSFIKKVIIEDGVTSIADDAFYNCLLLDSVFFPPSVSNVGSNAFSGCKSLNSVYITDLEAWCNITFDVWTSNPLLYAQNLYLNRILVTNLTIPDSVSAINDYAFYGCTSLVEVFIPDRVNSIGHRAFFNCSSLETINISSGLSNIDRNAFVGCSSLSDINVASNNAKYCSENGVLYNKDKTTLILYPVGKTATTFIVSDTVTSIGENAFNGCTSLIKIHIPSSVTSIENYAFCGCSALTEIYIPDTVTIIGAHAFESCTELTGIHIPGTLTTIGSYAFFKCSSLSEVHIPSSTTYIGQAAFYDSLLYDVYYESTEENWNSISMAYMNEQLLNATIHFNSPDEECRHKWEAGVITAEPTCNTEGIMTYTCFHCGDTYAEAIEKTFEHDYKAVVTDPTCTAPGCTTYICTCGDSYVADYVDIIPHSFTVYVVTTLKTCTTDGFTTYKCSRCTAIENRDFVVATHELVSVAAQAPTCTASGWRAYEYCTECDYTTYFEIPQNGHDHKKVVTAPTCTEKGYTTYTCACGDSYVADYVDAAGHSHIGEITTPATHLAKGVMTYTCTCGDTYTEVIEKVADHNYKSVVTKQATHLEEGIRTYTCECGDTYTETIAKTAKHTYTFEVIEEAQCKKDGKMLYACECGDSYTEKIPEHGHIDEDDNSSCDRCGIKVCDHMCHQSGFMGIIWKIVQFFWKLFKMNPVCECGAAHY